MSPEQIIKSDTESLTSRHDELIGIYGSNDNNTGGEYLLEEAALIELELKNRGFRTCWQKEMS